MKYILYSFLLFITLPVWAQSTTAPASSGPSETAPRYVESAPEYPGGENAMRLFFVKTLRYPDSARNAGIEGRVAVKFVIDEKGDVRDAKVIRGIGGGCDEEALRVINAMPRWKPGQQNGRNVRAFYVIPVNFSLDTPEVQDPKKR